MEVASVLRASLINRLTTKVLFKVGRAVPYILVVSVVSMYLCSHIVHARIVTWYYSAKSFSFQKVKLGLRVGEPDIGFHVLGR